MNNFWKYTNVRQMHIELTNACNAGCPMCVRFFQSSPLTRPDMDIGQITLEDFKKFFPPEFIKQLTTILFCGVSGDAGTARDTLEIMEYIASCNSEVTVRMNTNGGMRKPDWWEKLGKIFKNNKKYNWGLTFSVDGLEDTNHLYRRNVIWQNLIKNIEAFTSTGADTTWDYLIFEHNEHQIEQAKEIADSMNIHFRPKRALGVDDGEYLKPIAVRNKQGTIDYFIRAPKNPENRNLKNPKGIRDDTFNTVPKFDVEEYWNVRNKKKPLLGNHGLTEEAKLAHNQVTFEDNKKVVYETLSMIDTSKQDNIEISCKSAMDMGGTEIFVDQAGIVHPCCYIGTHLNSKFFEPVTTQLHHTMSNDDGWKKASLYNYSLKQILNSGLLNTKWANSWSKPTVQKGKTMFCADTCPKNKLSAVDKIFRHKDDPRTTESDWQKRSAHIKE